MNYGIVIAMSEGGHPQFVGQVDSREEALTLIAEYIKLAPSCDCLVPYEFFIQRRGRLGFYTDSELVDI